MSMFELFSYEFMQRAFLAGFIVGLVCSVMGVFVVLRGLAFIGAGISHSAYAGVAIGLLFGVSPLISSLVFCSAVACSVGYVSRLGKIKEDTSIGIFFAASMALGVFLMSFNKISGYDLYAYLFGSILTISNSELFYSTGLGVLVLIFVTTFYKEFLAIVFDEELALISGIPSLALSYLLLVLVSVAVVASIKLVGLVLVSALIVIPPATALQIARDFKGVMLWSCIVGVASTEIGLVLAYLTDTPPGATIVLFATLLFLISAISRRFSKIQIKSF